MNRTNLGNVLGESLREQRISQRRLGRETGVSHTQISRIINGKVVPRANTLVRISRRLGLSIEMLITLSAKDTIKRLGRPTRSLQYQR